MSIPRPEYPRPQFVREQWLNLNGVWNFAFDDQNVGLSQQWYQAPKFGKAIVVPFAFQSSASGIHDTDIHDVVWYARSFDIPTTWREGRVLLHFGAVDYRASVWVNGVFVASHTGGHTPFTADVTAALQDTGNLLVVRAEDATTDLTQPRGKQYWKRDSESIFYTRTTGIWQTVWLESVAECYLRDVRITPDVDGRAIHLDYALDGIVPPEVEIETTVYFGDTLVATQRHAISDLPSYSRELPIGGSDELHLWSPEQPNLYDITFRLLQHGQLLDEVRSYFGMRKISIHEGQVYLNNAPYYMRLVLDQGYHPDGVLSFPSDDDFKHDIDLTKRMGFNGVRKHQKVEDPRYLYWADQLGLLVWGEMANAYAFSPAYVQRITAEWQEVIRRDYNHPCIVAWVPINESWGVPDLKDDTRQRAHLESLYFLTCSLDQTRLVVSNDGWEHARTDLLTIHDYESSGAILRQRYQTVESTISARPANRDLYTVGYQHLGIPILLTEFGGIAYRNSETEGWGYSSAKSEADFLQRYAEIMAAVLEAPTLQGYCYTQLTDVEQEINGLLTYDRQPKVDLETLRQINQGIRA